MTPKLTNLTERTCYVCKIKQPIANFYADVSQAGGYRYECKKCATQQQKDVNAKDPIRYWSRVARYNHRARGFKIEISINELNDIAIKSVNCPICGCKLNYGNGSNKVQSDASPSLDRINNDDTIRKDNAWIICYSCNRTKSNRTLDEFIDYCKMVVDKSNLLR